MEFDWTKKNENGAIQNRAISLVVTRLPQVPFLVADIPKKVETQRR